MPTRFEDYVRQKDKEFFEEGASDEKKDKKTLDRIEKKVKEIEKLAKKLENNSPHRLKVTRFVDSFLNGYPGIWGGFRGYYGGYGNDTHQNDEGGDIETGFEVGNDLAGDVGEGGGGDAGGGD